MLKTISILLLLLTTFGSAKTAQSLTEIILDTTTLSMNLNDFTKAIEPIGTIDTVTQREGEVNLKVTEITAQKDTLLYRLIFSKHFSEVSKDWVITYISFDLILDADEKVDHFLDQLTKSYKRKITSAPVGYPSYSWEYNNYQGDFWLDNKESKRFKYLLQLNEGLEDGFMP